MSLIDISAISNSLLSMQITATSAKVERNNAIVDILSDVHRWFALGDDFEKGKGLLYCFVGSTYQLFTKILLSHEVEKIYRSLRWGDFKSHDGNEIYKRMLIRHPLPKKRINEINNYDNLVPFLNGYYSITTGNLIQPNPNYLFTGALQVNYTDDESCPQFLKFVERILPDEQSRMKVFAFLAYCMTPLIDRQLCQIWVGEGRNGKTEFMKIFDMLMPDFTVHVPIDALIAGNHKFIAAELGQKWVNAGSEMTPEGMSAAGITAFKRLITNVYQRSEAKNKMGETYTNMTKFIFDINEFALPNTFMTWTFYARLQIIEFTQRITNEEKVRNLFDQIWAAEGAQIVRYLLNFMPLLDVYLIEDWPTARDLWYRHIPSVFVFVHEICEVETTDYTNTEEVYECYCQYCKLEAREPVSKHHFGRLLKSQDITRRRGYEENNDRPYEYSVSLKISSSLMANEGRMQLDRLRELEAME